MWRRMVVVGVSCEDVFRYLAVSKRHVLRYRRLGIEQRRLHVNPQLSPDVDRQ